MSTPMPNVTTAALDPTRVATAREALAGVVRLVRSTSDMAPASRVWNLGAEAARYALRDPRAPRGLTAEEAREALGVTVAEAPDFLAGWAGVHAFPNL